MPDRPARLMTITVYVALMAAVAVGLKATAPSFSRWLGETFGQITSTVLVFAFFGACGLYGLWLRDAAGKMKSPLSRRR